MNLKNQFLLAMPGLADDYFADTLTYICEHTEEGAMGLVINRPLDTSLIELLAQLNLPTNRALVNTPVLDGGPVAPERGFVLHSSDRLYDSSAQLSEELCLSTALDVLEAIAGGKGPEDYLVALGYAGWDAEQLEHEVAENVWLTVPALTEVLFETPYDRRLQAAAKPLGIDFNLIAARPGHA